MFKNNNNNNKIKNNNNNDRKKREHHQNKNRTGASLSGIFLGLGLGSFLRELSRSDLKILGALTKGNSLKGLNKKSWLLSMRGLSITYRFCSLLGCIKVLVFTCLSCPRRLAFLTGSSGAVIARTAPEPATSAPQEHP